MDTNNILTDNRLIDQHSFVLDPLSVIIKLAILSNKPVGTKVCINKNIIYLQIPGLFQAFCRYMYKTNKTDLQYLYNPIELACQKYLSKSAIAEHPKLKELFKCAQNGVMKLIETYKNSSIMRLCLNYYYAIITNHVDQKYNDSIFYKDSLTSYYTKELIDALNEQWTPDKIKVILDLIAFLTNDTMAANNVKSLETIMENNDLNSQKILLHI
jgi:hypothetical protein